MKIGIDYRRLGIAMGKGSWFFTHPDARIPRCILCGRIELSYAELVVQWNESDGIHYLCHGHGGKDGKEYVDCLTGAKVSVGPEPSFVMRTIRNLLRENRYWLKVALGYLWLTICEYTAYILHPIRYIKYRRALKRLGW